MMHHQISRRAFLYGSATAIGTIGLSSGSGVAQEISNRSGESLSLWTDGPIRSALLDFVTNTTDPNSPDFLDPVDRIAVFDNDGTLWCEQPYYTQIAFMLDQLKMLFAEHPEWAEDEHLAPAFEGELDALLAEGARSALLDLMTALPALSNEQYIANVANWLETANHPHFDRRYIELVYTPMVQLLDYLRENDYQTWIVSGGGREFIRAFAEPVYGIPRDQIAGSTVATEFTDSDDEPRVIRTGMIDFVCDGPGKPVGIDGAIGRRPVLAFGNSDGDYEMLRYVTSSDGPRIGLLLHHDDAEREFAYDRESKTGQLSRGLDDAAANGWYLVSMERNFVEVFAS